MIYLRFILISCYLDEGEIVNMSVEMKSFIAILKCPVQPGSKSTQIWRHFSSQLNLFTFSDSLLFINQGIRNQAV